MLSCCKQRIENSKYDEITGCCVSKSKSFVLRLIVRLGVSDAYCKLISPDICAFPKRFLELLNVISEGVSRICESIFIDAALLVVKLGNPISLEDY